MATFIQKRLSTLRSDSLGRPYYADLCPLDPQQIPVRMSAFLILAQGSVKSGLLDVLWSRSHAAQAAPERGGRVQSSSRQRVYRGFLTSISTGAQIEK